MFNLNNIIAFSAFSAAFGIVFDRILLKRHKSQMHTMLVRWWVLLDNIALPNLHSLMADYTVRIINNSFLVRLGIWQAFVISLAISFMLTTFATHFGLHLENSTIDYGSWLQLPHFSMYFLNYFFDALTIIITYKLLKLISRSRFHIAVLVAGVDMAIAFSLMVSCLAAFFWVGNISFNARLYGTEPNVSWEEQWARKSLEKEMSNQIFTSKANIIVQTKPNLSEQFGVSFKAINSILVNGLYEFREQVSVTVSEGHKEAHFLVSRWRAVGWYPILVASTTFFPTVLYIIVLLLLCVGKTVLALVQAAIMYFLESATERDPKSDPKEFMPGTLFGITVAAISALVKLVFEIASN